MSNSKSNTAISVKDLHKSFKLPHEQNSGLKQSLVSMLRKGFKRGYENQHVLKGISFDIQKGDFFGIVGRNGSGKSTLLKLLAGIYTPDSGRIDVDGTVVPFIELGVGFNPDLTGRENVFLNGALLGFSRDEMQLMYDDIVAFAELERFMDQKLKNYSSGMQVRLAFSIAIKAQGDILILDEVLAVGDEAFQRKCNKFFEQIKSDKSKTVILVTHSMDAVRKYCNRAVLIENGALASIGAPDEVANLYVEDNLSNRSASSTVKSEGSYPAGLSDRVGEFNITSKAPGIITDGRDLIFEINYRINDDKPIYIAFSIVDLNRSGSIFDVRSATQSGRGRHTLKYKFPVSEFNNGDFMITAVLDEEETGRRIAFTNDQNSYKFAKRESANHNGGLLKSCGDWMI